MANPQQPPIVKLFIAILFKDSSSLSTAKQAISERWGSTDFEGVDHPFDCTQYYDREMGSPLLRRLISCETLISPVLLPDLKLACNDIEDALRINDNRTVNCDVGYLDHNKIVLASAKEMGQKIYIDKGIYADMVARYKNGKYQSFEWAFPDFKTGRYDAELLKIRSQYLAQKKRVIRANHE
jgi:hypothetical protein